MKICRKGHRHNDARCMSCNRAACAARYLKNKAEIAAKAKAQRAEYKALKAAAQAKEIAASK